MSSFGLEHLASIDAAIASGELSVSFNGRTVVYRSIKDLMAARDIVKAELAASGLIPKSKRFGFLARGRR